MPPVLPWQLEHLRNWGLKMNKLNSGFFSRAALHATAAMALSIASPSTTAITIATSADPADGWRVIAPVGNLEGQPITAAGLDWEAANPDWNTSTLYDDSDTAGWHTPALRDESIYGATSHNNVWADAEGIGETPAYFRKVFVLAVLPSAAWIGSSGVLDFSNVVDDDVRIYINGSLVFDDTDGFATFIPVVDVTSHLREGDNLIAAKAHDSLGGNEHFSLALRVGAIPEPNALSLVLIAAAALAASRRGFTSTAPGRTLQGCHSDRRA